MTKEALDRIKEAYYSGLKVQIWFDGHWENFDAREYSMYPDPFSENRMYRIVGSAYVDIAEKQIADLKKENAELKAENERIKTKYYELQETLKKVRLALIKERTANIMNYGKGGVEMFDDMFEILKGVSN